MIGKASALLSIFGAVGLTFLPGAIIAPMIAALFGTVGATSAVTALRLKLERERLTYLVKDLFKLTMDDPQDRQLLTEFFKQTNPNAITAEQLLSLKSLIEKTDVQTKTHTGNTT